MDELSVGVRVSDSRRLSALRQARLLDTPPEPAFDRLTALAQRVLGVPVALVSLVDHGRQFFKSQQGLAEPFASERETPLSHSFCQYVVATDAPLVVDDARVHPVVHDNLAIRDLGVVAYLGVPVHSPDGHPLGSLCAVDTQPRAWTDADVAVLRDLVDIAESEIALRAEVAARVRTEAQYRALFEASPDAVLLLELETETVLDANEPACALYGRSRAVLIGSTMRGASADPAAGEAALAQLFAEGGTVRFESVHQRADGTPFDVAISASLVHLGGRPVVVSVNRDVTERNHASAALRKSEGRYQTFLKLSAEGIWRFDIDEPVPVDLSTAEQVSRILAYGYLAECNAAMARMYGFEDEDALAGAQLSAFLDPADPSTVAYLTAFVEAGYQLDAAETHEPDRDGRMRVFENTLAGQVAAGPDGRPALVCAWGTQRDVTDRHEAEAALRDSEEQYRLLADTATDVILTIDATSTIRYANRAAETVFGYTPAELVGTSLSTLMPSGLRPGHSAGIGRYVQTGERTLPWGQVEARGLRKDGTEIQIAISFGEYVAGGERLFTGFVRDTTAQKATQEALVQSEAQFRQIADAMPQLVWTTDPAGRNDYFNERWYVYTGMPRPATQGGVVRAFDWNDYLHPDDAEQTFARWADSLATGEPYEIEYRFLCAEDGEYRWFIGRAEPVRNAAGTVVRWFGTCTDIHDLRNAREEVRTSEERLRLVGQATNDAVWDWNVVTGAVVMNEAFADVFGWTDPPEGGFTIDWMLAHVHPDEQGRVFESLLGIFKGRGQRWKDEYRFERADGTWADVITRGHIVRSADGRAVRIVGTMVDRTARKATELALVKAKEAAEEMARAKSSLLANMSHEIRTPLTAILGYTDLLADEAPPELMDLVEPIGRGGRRLMDTLNSVLDLAQIEAGEVSLASTRVDLLAEAEESCSVLRPLALAKGVDLQVVGLPVWALADRPAFGRVLANLVGNAVKFTERGSVTVEVGQDGKGGGVRVSDTGVGIAAEFLPALFSEFKQESEGHGRAYEGNGLGLAITKRLVDLMGGEIAVESEKEVGSVFTVRLPLAAEDVPARSELEGAGTYVL